MAQLVLGVAGAVVGSAFGMPGIGWAIGSAIGGALAPTQKSYGPRLSDLKVTTVEYGSPIPVIHGHPRISGTVAWCSDKIEVENTTSQGKGGGAESTSYTYKVNILILLADNEILGIRRIWSTGKLVWSIADDSDEETIEASEETTSWDAMRVYTGAMDQLPDPVYEAAVGLGSAPAYRGRGYVFFEGLNLGSSGQLPNLTFEVNAKTSDAAGATRLVVDEWAPADRRHAPVLGAAVAGVKMTTVRKGMVATWRTGPHDPVVATPPPEAEIRSPGMCNGDRALMVFGQFGGTGLEIWAGYCIAGDGIDTTIQLPEGHKKERLGTDSVRASTWLGNIAVSSADPIVEPGEWGNHGAIWLYTLTGDYVGRAFAGEPVTSLALTTSAIYAACSVGVRVFDTTTFAETDVSPITYPAGESGYRIFVGGSGVLCCAVAESVLGYANVYTWDGDTWILDKSVSMDAVDVDFGTTEAHHFRTSSKDVYTVVPKKVLPPVRIFEWYAWLFPHDISEGPVTDNILDASAVDDYVFSREYIDGNSLTEISSPKYQQTGYSAYAVPTEIPVPNPVEADQCFIVGQGVVLADIFCKNISGYYARQGAYDYPLRIRLVNYLQEEENAHSVYITPSDQSGALVPKNLQTVAEEICYSAGLAPDDIDASALADDWVYAFAIPPGPAKAALDQLAAAYYFESYESDKLYFVKRGGDPVLTIPYRDLGADAQLQITDPNDLELPAQVYVTYQNLSDDYQQGSEQSDRLTTDSTAINNIQLALGFEPAQAKGIADTACLDQTIGARSLAFALDRRYAQIVPTDVVLLDDSFGNTFRARVIKVSDADGVRTVEAVADDASALNPTGTTSDNYTPRYTVRARALTDLLLLDMPILRDVDDTPSLYAVGDGLGGTWPGWALYINSAASGTSPNGAQQGAAVDVLGDWAGHLADECNSVTVQLNPGDQLTSITHDQLTSTILNYAVLGVHGRWEVIQFRSAQLVATGRYKLTGIIRGQLGTEQHRGSHQVGDRFVLLTGDGMLRPPGSVADILQPRAFLGVTIGARLDSATAQTFTLTGEGLRPYAPVNLRQAPQPSGDLVLTWDRRTRYQVNLLTGVVPLGEAAEAYDIEIYSGATLKRTLASTTPTATYTAAQQVADFGATQASVSTRIYQRSAIVGRGTPLIFEA